MEEPIIRVAWCPRCGWEGPMQAECQRCGKATSDLGWKVGWPGRIVYYSSVDTMPPKLRERA